MTIKCTQKKLNGMSEFSGALIGDNLASFFSLDCVCLFLHSRFSISFLYNKSKMHLHYFINVILHSFSSLSIPFLQQYLNPTQVSLYNNTCHR